MLRASLVVLLLPFLCLAVPRSLKAQRPAAGRSTGGVIEVQVRYATGEPGPREIHVRLESAEGGAAGDCQTRDGGKCQFNLGSSGVYFIRVAEQGYQEVSARVELIGTPRGYATLELKPIPEKTPAEPPKKESARTVSAAELNVPDNARHEYEKALIALKQNKLDASADHFRKAIRLYDAFPPAHRSLGSVYVQQQKYKDAQSALKKAIELDPKLSDAYLELGAVYNQTKEYPIAEIALNKGLELSPDASGGHYELAKTYWAMGRWQDAAPHAQAAVTGMPSLAAPHVLLGNILLKKSDLNGALHEYQEYLRLDPDGSMAAGTREIVEKIRKALENK